jgi:hypothetical protein
LVEHTVDIGRVAKPPQGLFDQLSAAWQEA